MAETQIFDQVKAAGDAIRKPAYVNVFAQDYKPLPGPTARGFKTAIGGAKAAAGGLAAVAGDVAGIESLKQYGLGVAQRATDETAQYSMPVEQVDSVGSAVDFAKYAVGHTGGNLLTLLAGGVFGRVGGAALARGVPAAAEKLLLKNAGMTAGLAAGSVGQEIGSIYPDAIAAGIPDAAARSVIGGTAAGALDMAGPALLASRLGLFGKALPAAGPRTAGKIATGAINAAAEQAAVEGGTEIAQTAIERAAAGLPLKGDEAFSQFLNAGAIGAIGGGVFGGVAGGIEASHPGVQAPAATQPTVVPSPTGQPIAAPSTSAAAVPAPAVPTPFQAAAAEDLRIVQEPDRMSLVDTSPSPATPEELQLIQVQDNRKAAQARLSALDIEEQQPAKQRRSKQAIAKDRAATNADIAALTQRESNLNAIMSGPQYTERGSLVRPTIIGEQPVAAAPAAIITPEQDAALRVAEQEAADAANQKQVQGSLQQERVGGSEVGAPAQAGVGNSLQRAAQSEVQQAVGAESVQTRLALGKRFRGELLTAEEAAAVRKFEATVPAIARVTTSSSRGALKQPGGKQARENFVSAYTSAVDSTVNELGAQTQMSTAKLASIKSALKRAAEKAVQQPDAESAQQVLNDGFAAALKGKLPAQDVEVFSERLAREVAASAPPIVGKYFSKAAVTPTDTVVFSHWGNVPGGITDPTKMGTGVRGADWESARAVGLTYTSAVVKGSAYAEPDVQTRTSYVGSIPANRVYQADRNDPLLAQARSEIAPQFGPDENIAWAQYAKKVRDLGYDAIQYANGQLRIFTSQAVYKTPGKAEAARAASAASALHTEFNGSSYNVVTGQDMGGTLNFAVSPYKGREVVVPGKQIPEAMLRSYIEANNDLLTDPRNILGTWYNEADGNSYLDVSVVTTNMQEAMRIATENNQIAAFDLRTYTDIPAGHPVFTSAQEYVRAVGMMPIMDTPYIQVNPELGSQIARVYEGLQVRSDDPAVAQAYAAFAAEIEAQFDAAARVIKIEPWTQEGQPYATSAEMRADVFANNHIYVFEGGEPHPFLTAEQNWKFRAIHDIYGHAKTGFEFGPRGELNATRAHARMFSPAATPALVTETIGQNSWVNFSEANAGLPAEQRAFAVQKADLLPESLWAPLLDDGKRLRSQAAQRFGALMAHKGNKMLDALEAIVGTPTRLTAKVLGQVEGGTGSITFGQARDVIAMSVHVLDGTSLAAHEGYHYLEQRVLSRDEKAIISRAFKRGSSTYNALMTRARAYDRTNGTNISNEIAGSQREATAYGYEFWNRGELTASSTLERVWQKIKQVAVRIANTVRGLGFQSHEDIFRAIQEGQYAQRGDAGMAAYAPEPSFSRGATTAQVFVEDIPSEAWLQEQVSYAASKPRNAYGVPYMGKITGSFKSVEVPVAALAQLRGERGEQQSVRTNDLRGLVDEMAENGLKNTGRPYIEVGYDGVPWISEGNHRIMAAAQLLWEKMPIELRYFDGGNRAAVEGWSPAELIAQEQSLAQTPVLFSQAAQLESAGDMALRVQAGELPRTQLNIRMAEILDDKTIPNGLREKLFDGAADEFRSWGGSAKRLMAENILSGQNLSRKSNGYRNVFGVLTSYVQRKNVLIADAVEKRLSTWVTGANKEDKVAVSAALLTRTENGWTTGSDEYLALRSSLNDAQRAMFDQATEMINSRLDAELVADIPAYRKTLDEEAFAEWYANRHAQVERLKAEGYFPERRFGDHVVHAYVLAPDGKKVTAYFSQHEREADARRELDELNRLAGNEGLTFEYGYRYRAEYDGSISFGQFLTAADRVGVKLTQMEKERIGKALISADSTRRNRVFHRKNIAGYSQDGMRILAEFGVTMANKVAYAELGEAINDAMSGLRVDVAFDNRGQVKIDTLANSNVWADDGPESGFYRNVADETVSFVLSPREGSTVSSKLRGAATAHFLGGSIAAAMVNMSSLPMNTVPWLSQHTSYTDAMSKVLGAVKTAASNFNAIRDLPTLMDTTKQLDGIDDVEGLRHALQVAAQDGTILDTEIYQIMGLSRGQEYSMSGAVQKAVQVWMTPFRLAEQMNRMATFIAAYKVAKGNNLDNDAAYSLAQETVYSTQFRYDDANRPALARGDFGSILFVFKSYPIFVLETLSFLAKENPRAAAFMLGTLVMVAGVQGLPFAEDLEDLIDTIAQRLFDSPFNSQRWLRNTLKTASEAVTGTDLSSVFMHGTVNTMTELNFASRVGLGNLIPGTRIGAADADYKSVMTEVIGPTGAMVGGVLAGVDALNRGEFVEAARKALPLGAQNFVKGAEQWNSGFATDVGGRKLVDVSGWEAFWQSFGMSSAAVSDAYTADRIDRQTVAYYTYARDAFQTDIVRAVKSGDASQIKDATDAVASWNKTHPDMTMNISAATIRKAVSQAGMTLNQRTLEKLPKQLRGTSEAALGLDGEE
jgi:hypothetical protein